MILESDDGAFEGLAILVKGVFFGDDGQINFLVGLKIRRFNGRRDNEWRAAH